MWIGACLVGCRTTVEGFICCSCHVVFFLVLLNVVLRACWAASPQPRPKVYQMLKFIPNLINPLRRSTDFSPKFYTGQKCTILTWFDTTVGFVALFFGTAASLSKIQNIGLLIKQSINACPCVLRFGLVWSIQLWEWDGSFLKFVRSEIKQTVAIEYY